MGSLGLAKAAARLRALPTVAGATVLAALLTGALGLGELSGRQPSLSALLAVGFALGVASSLAQVPLRALIQAETPPGTMGRVAALTEALSVSTLLVAPFCGAALATATSVGAAFVLGSVLSLLVAVGAALLAQREGRAG